MQTLWVTGDKAKYTGKSQVRHGVRWFFAELIEGYRKGDTVAVSQCPECGLCYYESKPVGCSTCELDVAPALPSDIN